MKTARITLLVLFAVAVSDGGLFAGGRQAPKDQGDWSAVLELPKVPRFASAVPSPGQLRYQTNQLGAFLHYGPAIFLDGDWRSTPDPKIFNPTELNAEQWVLVAKSFGAKHLVFSSKHHNGFCLWPTKTTDYSVRSCPWKKGKGDVVREIADVCKKHGIAPGLYYSGHDRHFPCYGSDPKTYANREAYWPVYRQQIEELVSNDSASRVLKPLLDRRLALDAGMSPALGYDCRCSDGPNLAISFHKLGA